jgi:hypothetical protein
MCDPVTISVVAGSALNLGQQIVGANSQEKFQDQQFKTNKRLADQNALAAYESLTQRQVQENAKATDAVMKASRASREALSTSRVSAGESGVAGLSVDALQADFERSELDYQNTVTRNREFLDSQFKGELEAIRAGQEGRILQGVGAPIRQPDYANAFIRGFSSVLSVNSNKATNTDPYEDR